MLFSNKKEFKSSSICLTSSPRLDSFSFRNALFILTKAEIPEINMNSSQRNHCRLERQSKRSHNFGALLKTAENWSSQILVVELSSIRALSLPRQRADPGRTDIGMQMKMVTVSLCPRTYSPSVLSDIPADMC